jgi:hypothetical protein
MKLIVLLMSLSVIFTLGMLVSCHPVHNYVSAIDYEYGPHPPDSEIDVYAEAPPGRRYVVIGHVDCRGATLEDVLPYFKKMARENGGDAIININSEPLSGELSKFTADVIRYK